MARQSIDDKERRDPRLNRLAASLGWSLRETFGALYDVNDICHDRITDILPELDINTTVWREAPPGTPVDFDFASKLVAAGYAVRHSAKRMIRLVDMAEKILYLRKKSKSGIVGGINSGKSRAKGTKQKYLPSDALALPLDLATPTSPDSDLPRAEPEVLSLSGESASPVSAEPGDDVDLHFPRPRLRVVGAHEALALEIGRIHAHEFQRVKAALGSGSIGPEANGPHAQLERLLETTTPSRDQLLHAIAVQAADALKKRTLQYFGPGMWKPDNFTTALAFDPAVIAQDKPASSKRDPAKDRTKQLPLVAPPATPSAFITADDPEAAVIFDFDGAIAAINRAKRAPP